jgi:regulator of cell morphogenesis and NO signaling
MPGNSYILSQVVQRYSIALPEGDRYFYDQLHSDGLDKDFIFSILNSFEEKKFNTADFASFGIEMIVDYIQRTHLFYTQQKLPEIEQSILQLHGFYKPSHPLLKELRSFFRNYQRELEAHFTDEESKLMPYIVLLRNAEKSAKGFSEYAHFNGAYSIVRFLTEHHDTEDDLAEMRKTIRMYNPPPASQITYRTLLTQLELFEQDLHVHARMEEDVLIPKALKIETALNEKFAQLTKLN